MFRTRVSLLVLFSCCALPAFCSTFAVNSTVDAPDVSPGDGVCAAADGVCTLRAATMEANALPGHDTIEVPAGVYALTLPSEGPWGGVDSQGDLEITDHATVIGVAAETTFIDASAIGDRVVSILGARSTPDPLQVELAGLTLTGGSTAYVGGCVLHRGNGTLTLRGSTLTGCSAPRSLGGGIYHDGTGQVGRVDLIDSIVSNNSAHSGGGIFNGNGDVTLIRSVITDNRALSDSDPYNAQWGGGIGNSWGDLIAIDSVISNNVAGRSGGGISAAVSRISLNRTIVSGNTALNVTGVDSVRDGRGGGIWIERCSLDLLNSTVSNNTADRQGGGIFSEREGAFLFAFSTIADNQNLSGLGGAGMTMMDPENRPRPWYQLFQATIIAGNLTDGISSNCLLDTPAISNGFNIDSDGTCGLTAPADRPGIDPDLGPLADNGGFSETHALLPGSVAIDLVPYEECVVPWDNDWDYEVDEDPVDGIDNDGDGRIDEDPEDRIGVDQRGFDRPAGAACDVGSYEREETLTVEERIDELIIDVRELIDAGEIRYGRGRSLIAELQVALWFLKFNNGESIAAVRIELFIIKVKGMITRGEVDPVLGTELLSKARTILELLRN